MTDKQSKQERMNLSKHILNNEYDLIKLNKKSRLLNWKKEQGTNQEFIDKLQDEIDPLMKKYKDYPYEVLKQANRIVNNEFARNKRLKNKIQKLIDLPWLNENTYFITITFTDKQLQSTSHETRKRYVKAFFKSLGTDYIANVDYGETTDREHYHGLININGDVLKAPIMFRHKNKLKMSYPLKDEYMDSKHFGYITLEKINTNEDDTKRLAKYVSKLTNHAIKETANSERIIYSRRTKNNGK